MGTRRGLKGLLIGTVAVVALALAVGAVLPQLASARGRPARDDRRLVHPALSAFASAFSWYTAHASGLRTPGH